MRLDGRTVLITGSTAGVGAAAARRLAALGARVVLHGRDAPSGEALASELTDAGPGRATFLRADFASLEEVRAFAGRALEDLDHLDALVLNAGLASARRVTTPDGFELTFAVNHLAHFLLAHRLLDALRETAARGRAARIVVVSSNGHRHGNLDLERVVDPPDYGGWMAYANSKLANVLFAREAARRWRDHGITVNALHPGVLATRIWDRNRGFVWGLARFAKVFMGSPDEGGRAVEHLVADPGLEGVTGAYFDGTERAEPGLPPDHEELARRLWEHSRAWVGLAEMAA
ncbi:MAG TPA: SDR family NAD(P)-dependent oxidoreductase [Longimicrobiales bacterium]|nr:SDR family NAD(P)-dependent oxidoreductase [Longimicrobiales bacterium]